MINNNAHSNNSCKAHKVLSVTIESELLKLIQLIECEIR